MPFKKDQSGNPGGKPKELWEIRLEARKLSNIALETLATVCREGKSEAARVAAAMPSSTGVSVSQTSTP